VLLLVQVVFAVIFPETTTLAAKTPELKKTIADSSEAILRTMTLP
jgi:hypothetical protein